MATVAALLAAGAARLSATSPSPRLDAELLLAHVTGLSRIRFVADPGLVVDSAHERFFEELIARRSLHEPVAYLVGEKEFYGLEFEVGPAVLVPRPETELVVEVALSTLPRGPVRFLDLGTGSGCIAVALAHTIRARGVAVSGIAVDVSAAALSVAERNIARHGLSDVIACRVGCWFEPVAPTERFDVIVSNPPYIEPGDPAVSPEVHFEPLTALYAPHGGLSHLVHIFEHGPAFLSSSGAIVCECGSRQRPALEAGGLGALEFRRDLAGQERVVVRRVGL
jgi:release factor glutamine methyltransferase